MAWTDSSPTAAILWTYFHDTDRLTSDHSARHLAPDPTISLHSELSHAIMFSFNIRQPFFLLSVLLVAASTQALPSPSCQSAPAVAPVFGFEKAFGVSAKRFPETRTTKATVASLRGGAVIEPETLEEVEAILVKAGSEGKLVVIDFSATW